MLMPGDGGGHEDAQMPHMRIKQVDDALARRLQCCGVRVDSRQPGQRLVRRRDVVAAGCEDDDRVANLLQVDDSGSVIVHVAGIES